MHRKGFRVTQLLLVTTLLDAVRYPVDAFAKRLLEQVGH